MHWSRRRNPALPRVVSLTIVTLAIAAMTLSMVLLPHPRSVIAQTSVVDIQRVSIPGAEGDYGSQSPSISADGRYVAFQSYASNLVLYDYNGLDDIFVYDQQTGETTMVSVASDGTQSDNTSTNPSISADGRYVAFESVGSNLVTSDNNGCYDVFVRDRYTRTTTRVSLASDNSQADAPSWGAMISANGRYVAFESFASNLVASDNNGTWDVFVRDLQTGVTTRVSVDFAGVEGNGQSLASTISADGWYVAFQSSASNLVADDTNSSDDIFVHDCQTGVTTRVSVDSGGTEGDDGSYGPGISADGRYVAFQSTASNLVADDTNSADDIFIHDRQTAETTRVSVDSSGTEGDDGSYEPLSISADGRYVAFPSDATNLVGTDANGYQDVFIRDREMGETTMVSLASDNTQGNSDSYFPAISADGRYVAFTSDADNLLASDGNAVSDVFVRDRQIAETTRVSVGCGGEQGNGDSGIPDISANGRYVAFASAASNLVASDNNGYQDVFVRDRERGQTTRVSLASDNTQGNENSGVPSISADGRYVAFQSAASNLVASDNNGVHDVFVHDRQTGQTARVSLASDGTQADLNSLMGSISADGRYVAFQSAATNLVASDNNSMWDVFVHDRQTGQTTRVSVDSDGVEGDGTSWDPSISADGRYVAFYSYATNLLGAGNDTNSRGDVFVHDRTTGITTRVSEDSSEAQANSDSLAPSISADGRYVAFESYASNLVAGDTNSRYDIFVRDRQLGLTARVSLGAGGAQANNHCYAAAISGDGLYVAFESEASNLVAGDTNSRSDIFVNDRQSGETTRVSLAFDGSQGGNHSFYPSVDADGQNVAFYSEASGLVYDDTNGYQDAFVVSWQNTALAYAPTSIDFGAQYQDSTDNETLQVYNSGKGLLSYSLSENSTWCSITPDAGDSTGETDNISVAIDTSGLSPGSYGCVILIDSDAGLGIVPVHLSVQLRPTIAVVPMSHDFGSVAEGSSSDRAFTVSNSGPGNLIIGTVAAANPLAVPYSIVSDNCSGQTVLPGDNCTLTVRFSPTVKGTFNDSFSIPSNDPDNPTVTVTLTGASPNRVPTAPVVNVTPDSPTTSDDLVCGITTASTDADGDTITYAYQWYKDDALQPSMTTDTVGAAETAKGQVWKCVVTPNDGTANGPSEDDQVTIQNSAPTAPVVDVTPNNPTTASDLVCSVTTASTDADGDTITYGYQWFKDNVQQTSLTADTVASAETAKGQVWRCTVTPGDGTAAGSSAEDQVTIQNSAPTAPVVGVTPESPTTTADLVCSTTAESTDADGDTITYAYQWYRDDVLQTSLTSSTVGAAQTAKGQVWRCVVTPGDGTTVGSSGEDQVTIQNAAPTAPAVDVIPDDAATVNDLVCSIATQSNDADGDTVVYTYQWYADGVLQTSLSTSTVGAAQTAKGQVWRCVVTPSDGAAVGSSAEDQVTIQNSAPTAPVVAVTPDSPDTGDDLVCSIANGSMDVDGDVVAYNYRWYKDDVLQPSLTTSTVAAAETAKGQAWKCVVTPTDGTASGPSVEDEVAITGPGGGFPVWAVAVIAVGALLLIAAAALLWLARSKGTPPAS